MKNFERHASDWRDPAQIAGQWQSGGDTDPELLGHTVRGRWWETLAEHQITLLVTRETEHLIVAMRCDGDRPDVSFVRIPHPSGLAVDRELRSAFVASTRNPNQVFEFIPARTQPGRPEMGRLAEELLSLVPIRSQLYPGSLYIHDLGIIGGALHAAAVGQNAIVQLDDDAGYRRVWWPRAIESSDGPNFRRNHLQLNSIAAAETVEDSYFAASAERISVRRPGHLNFPVDRRGVILSGRTREPIVRGLTRPHSARLYRGQVWVDDSGYGTFGPCIDDRYTPAAQLPGWTRGLCFSGSVAFVGTSHVIPRYRRYAPGLDVKSSRCGVHAVDVKTGAVLGSILWPTGNQIFGIDWVDSRTAAGLPFRFGRGTKAREHNLFYSFATDRTDGGIDAAI